MAQSVDTNEILVPIPVSATDISLSEYAKTPEHERMLEIILESMGMDDPRSLAGLPLEKLFDPLLLLASQFSQQSISTFRKNCLAPLIERTPSDQNTPMLPKLPDWFNTEADRHMLLEVLTTVIDVNADVAKLDRFLQDANTTRDGIKADITAKFDAMIAILEENKAAALARTDEDYGAKVDEIREKRIPLATLRDELVQDQTNQYTLLRENFAVSPKEFDTVFKLRGEMKGLFDDARDKRRQYTEKSIDVVVPVPGEERAIVGVAVSLDWFQNKLEQFIAIRGRTTTTNEQGENVNVWTYEENMAMMRRKSEDAQAIATEATEKLVELESLRARLDEAESARLALTEQLESMQATERLREMESVRQAITQLSEKLDNVENKEADETPSVIRAIAEVTGALGLLRMSDPFADSRIVEKGLMRSTLAEWCAEVGGMKTATRLLYRATKGNDDAETFHRMCDEASCSVVVVRDMGGNVFGGFSGISWAGKGYVACENAFLFTLHPSERKVDRKHSGQEARAVFCRAAYGPTFGYGHDLYLASGCCSNRKSYSTGDRTYESGYARWLTNDEYFQVDMYEVFELVEETERRRSLSRGVSVYGAM